MLKDKVNNFVIENHMEQLNKDPTEAYQRQIQQTVQKCNRLTDKHVYKYLLKLNLDLFFKMVDKRPPNDEPPAGQLSKIRKKG